MFTEEKLEQADLLTANYFSNAVLINDGQLHFSVNALPWQAQLSCFRDAAVVDANGDHLPDILLGGNFNAANTQMGRYDADYGSILINKGQGKFSCEKLSGLAIKGEIRHIAPINISGKPAWLLGKNNDSLQVIQFLQKITAH